MRYLGMFWILILGMVLFLACGKSETPPSEPISQPASAVAPAEAPPPLATAPALAVSSAPRGPFVLSVSEYPSWATFPVAHELGLINGKEGELGTIEKKWKVDIVLKETDYDTCITMYGSGQADAVAITNMDALNPSLGRQSVAILPTSTSYGGDACLVTPKVKSLRDLKKFPTYGLDGSVSRYVWARTLKELGENPSDYEFKGMDPGAAANAMQTKQEKQQAIMVWHPFVLETLAKRPDARVLFDSTKTPGEIIDMIVMGQDSLDKPGGGDFAKAVIETYYTVNQRLADPATHGMTLVALGAKFSNLNLDQMAKVVEQVRFYGKPEWGLGVFTGGTLFPWDPSVSSRTLKDVMWLVTTTCKELGILTSDPSIGYGPWTKEPSVALRFDPTYMQVVAEAMRQ